MDEMDLYVHGVQLYFHIDSLAQNPAAAEFFLSITGDEINVQMESTRLCHRRVWLCPTCSFGES